MHKIRLIIFFTTLSFGLHAHDLQISLFEVSRNEEDRIKLFVRLDKDDILKELYASCEDYNQVEMCLENYLNNHFSLSMDGNDFVFKIKDLEHTKEFIEVSMISSMAISTIERIEMFNDVLIKNKPAQENIVRFSFNDQKRSFRMNKERIKTSITY